MGGTPKDPKLIEGWLRAKAGIDDAFELQQAMLRTLVESGYEVREDMTYEEVQEATNKIAGSKETSGFKRGEHGLYFESRQVKAALRESCNILYAGERVGPTKKGAKAFLAERVFVSPDQLWLDRREPDGVEMVVGHVSGPQGPRSTLGYHEYVRQAELQFDVLVTRDAIPHEWWPELWEQMQEIGLGALRSQGYGRFDIESWDEVDPRTAVPEPSSRTLAAAAA